MSHGTIDGTSFTNRKRDETVAFALSRASDDPIIVVAGRVLGAIVHFPIMLPECTVS
jgi:hypothetical protein